RFLRCIAHGDEERAANTGVEDIGGVMRANEGTSRLNRERSERNVREGNLVLNSGDFGTGVVYRNFSPAPVLVSPFRYRRISFCTASMGRLHHLLETLPQNIENNRSYPDLEFVLLDYNSQDGLEEWAKQHLAGHIEDGRLVYYKYTGRKYFDRSHARNLAARLASGEIICNIDADNFTGVDFAHYINERFSHSSSIFLRPDFDGAHSRLRDAFGRLCVMKSHFHAVEGYDEKFIDYGYEDNDLCSRLEKNGIEPALIEDQRFLRYIEHNNFSRMENGMLAHRLALMLEGRYADQEWDTLVCLFDDGEFFCSGPLLNSLPGEGRWEKNSSGILLQSRSGHVCRLFNYSQGRFSLETGPDSLFVLKESNNMSRFMQAYFNHSLIRNERRFRQNRESRSGHINERNYGLATVFRNFKETPIQLKKLAPLERVK
ncbi:MAG TPA: glycosyltransferase family A protein, partial [Bacteroidia bacterium]|nr:glycosyltransferase family A protein [Bacteroidia bacterium]